MLSNALYKAFVLLAVTALGTGLYLPFGWLSAEYMNTFLNGGDNSYYWFASGIWPLWTFLFFFLPFLAAILLRVRWYLAAPMLLPLLVLWTDARRLCDWLGLPAVDATGLTAWVNNSPELNTSKLSVFAQPVFLLAGTIAGTLCGRYFRSLQGHGCPRLHACWRAGIAVVPAILYAALIVFPLADPLSDRIVRSGMHDVWTLGLLSLFGWFLPIVSLPIVGYAWLTRRYGSSGGAGEPSCPHCGYILIGLSEPRCPECGRPMKMPCPQVP